MNKSVYSIIGLSVRRSAQMGIKVKKRNGFLKRELFLLVLCCVVFLQPALMVQAAEAGGEVLRNYQAMKEVIPDLPEYVQPQNPWDGTSDVSWYDSTGETFIITTPQQLAGLARLVNGGNTFEGKKIILGNDIFMNGDLYEHIWIPIGSGETADGFSGVFDGRKHRIYNLYTDGAFKGGLFGKIGEAGIVKGVSISQGDLYAGASIADRNDGIVAFCMNYSSVWLSNQKDAGGICRQNYNLIYGCKNFGEVWGSGIADLNINMGQDNPALIGVISQCSNHGMVHCDVFQGAGIAGRNDKAWIYNCYNVGSVSDGAGICYDSYTGRMENCYFAGKREEGDPLGGEWEPICKQTGISPAARIRNCYALVSDKYEQMENTVSESELKSRDFIRKIDCQIRSAFPVWQQDRYLLNNGYPVTAADISYASGECKIQPEAWILEGEEKKTIELQMDYLEDTIFTFSFAYYYCNTEPVVTIADTKIAAASEWKGTYSGNAGEGSCGIRLKKPGETKIRIHFPETEHTCSVDYEMDLIVREKECNHTQTRIVDKKEASCTKNGYTGDTKCIECGKVIKKGKVIKAKGHSYKNIRKEATLSKNGSIVKKCTVCKKTKDREIIYYPKTVKLSPAKSAYTGKKQKPAVIVKDANGETISGSHYKVSYGGSRKKVGKYQVTVTFRGNYKGTKRLYYTVEPAPVQIKLVVPGKRQLKIRWTKNNKELNKQVDGYEIACSTDSDFSRAGTVKIKVEKNSSVNKTVTGLKGKRRYYVRIRTYKEVSGKKYYSKWSDTVNAVTKK